MSKEKLMTSNKVTTTVARREFLAGTAAAAAFSIVRPSAVRGSTANSTIELGLLGCGGRGTWIVPLFQKHGKYKFVTCGDYYPQHADRVGEMCKIPANKRFSTLSACRKMYDTKFDAVVIETPPYFHPEQAAAAVAAGKHVYCAKPIAVDVPGCQSFEASGKKATEKKLVFLVDFQTRANEHYREAARHVRRPPAQLVLRQSHFRRLHRRAEHPRTGRGHLDDERRPRGRDGSRRLQGPARLRRHLGFVHARLRVPR
jgi:predicted dehydrogenase